MYRSYCHQHSDMMRAKDMEAGNKVGRGVGHWPEQWWMVLCHLYMTRTCVHVVDGWVLPVFGNVNVIP